MRRLVTLAAFVVVFALIPMSAQRGGVRGGGLGGHGVVMAHPAGGGHSFGGHGFGGVGSGPNVGSKFSGGRGFQGGGFRHDGFHHRRFGYGFSYGYPWYLGYGYGYGYYDPYWYWESASSYDYDREQEREIQIANQQNALSIQEQNLREREEWLREREEGDEYVRQASAVPQSAAKPSPATVLVFRDQHQQEITNYAISSGTLWVLNDHLIAKKIPLTDLDLSATAKANDERGVEFQVPK